MAAFLRPRLSFELDMPLEEFSRKRLTFQSDLAKLLRAEFSDIEILSITTGCTYVELCFLKQELLEAFLKHKNEDSDSSSEYVQLQKKYGIKSVRVSPATQMSIFKESKIFDDRSSLTWLHISDMHFRSGEGATQWSQDKTIGKFHKSVDTLLQRWDLKPEILFVTGDVTFSGQAEVVGPH